ncbi:unnamed protein product [Linum trigynum]|uniref:Uncharacterized protein n=1 Tax=Linum trigynum TaxID=586398 RepID=A0AAV2GIN0_9ROSI
METGVPDRSYTGSGRRTAGAKEIPGPSGAWTNEKHHLYLHSLEASFLEQLHQSISLRGCLRKVDCRPYSSRQAKDCNSLQQGTFQRDSKQKINCEGDEDLFESTCDSHFVEGSPPSMHHDISEDSEHTASSDLHSAFGKEGKRKRNELPVSPASTQSSSDTSFLEVSDQNFADDDDAVYKSSPASRLKRSKTDGPSDHFSAFRNTEDIT